jgi:hypothetical protein
LCRAGARLRRERPDHTLHSTDIVHEAFMKLFLASAYAVSTGTGFSRDGRREWLDSATAHAHAAIALDPSMPDGHAALGVAYRWAGRLEDAALQHRLALGRDPQYTLSLVELGFVYHLLRQPDEAISIASLQSWFDNGGLRAWTRDRNEHWGSVADDPRFRDIVGRSQQRFDEKRARITGEPSTRRD